MFRMSFDSRGESTEFEISPYQTSAITDIPTGDSSDNFLESLLQTRYHTSSFDNGIIVRDRQVAKQLARDIVAAMSVEHIDEFESCLRDNYNVMHKLSDDLTSIQNLVSRSCILANITSSHKRQNNLLITYKIEIALVIAFCMLLYMAILMTVLTTKLLNILP